MGSKSSGETIARILLAFSREQTWRQAELARVVGVGVQQLRARLLDLNQAGMPLESSDEAPHVYWSVPLGWFPDAVLIPREEVPELLRWLSRLPKTRAREAWLRRVIRSVGLEPISKAVVTPEVSESEEARLSVVMEAAQRRFAVRIRYASTGDGLLRWRDVSIQRVYPSDARFAAICHQTGKLKWYVMRRLAEIERLEVEHRVASPEQLEALERGSFGGYFSEAGSSSHAFLVSEPASRWVADGLPSNMVCEPVVGGIRVTVRTGAVHLVARFVIGLGEHARSETPELRAAVVDLARAALTAHEAPESNPEHPKSPLQSVERKPRSSTRRQKPRSANGRRRKS